MLKCGESVDASLCSQMADNPFVKCVKSANGHAQGGEAVMAL